MIDPFACTLEIDGKQVAGTLRVGPKHADFVPADRGKGIRWLGINMESVRITSG